MHTHYLSTAAAGQPQLGGRDDKKEEPTTKKKKEPSPEECDQAVEGLSSVKANAKAQADGDDDHTDLMDYAQAPLTPGLVEESNLSNVKDASAYTPQDRQQEESDNLSVGLEMKESNPQGESHIKGQDEAMVPTSEFSNMIVTSDARLQEDLKTEAVKDGTHFVSIDETIDKHQNPNEVDLGNSAAEISCLTSTAQQISEGVASVTLVSGPCNSIVENPDVTKPGYTISTGDADVQSDIAALETIGRNETMEPGKEHCITTISEQNLKKNQVQEHTSGADIQVAINEADAQVHNKNSTDNLDEYLNNFTEPDISFLEKPNSKDSLVENLNNAIELELPAPEKLLSVPEGHMDSHRDVLVEVSPSDFFEGFDAGSKFAAGKKRSFTEIVRRSSVLKVKPTPPLSEVTSMKRTSVVPRSTAQKRKVLNDDTIFLHGDMIRHQLTDTGYQRRVRMKAPCTLIEISMIQKQHMEDENFLGTIFTGMSAELASLHDRTHNLSRISICKDDLEESKYRSTDFSFGQEQTKPANNDVGPDDSQVIPGVEPLDMVQTDPLNEISEGNYQVNVDASVDAVPDQTMHIPSTELEKDEIEDGLNIEKDGEKEIDVKDDILTDVV
ncbi:hypothetical protein CASFOL_023938 [Castilleja foliolosa]|uniref:Uncharacterized protein n=1 Tax=Castilleja foliolosa TaxID=1961234 RepID=A0ABD3CNZ5_9LAMI